MHTLTRRTLTSLLQRPGLARTDVDVSQMDVCAQAGMVALKDASRQLAVPDMLITPDKNGAVQDAITQFWNKDLSVDDASKALTAALSRN